MAERDSGGESFWRFSLMVYGRPGVADALIRLQDRGGHNVNLILYGAWLGVCEGAELDATGLAAAKTAISRLDDKVVAPLRLMRRALKDEPDPDIRALRRRMLALEIAAERRVQERLAASAPTRPLRSGAGRALAEANLRLVLGADFDCDEAVLLCRAVATLASF